MTTKFVDPPAAPPEPVPVLDPIALVLADALREVIWTGAINSERSLQREVGMSEIGNDCDRELAYKIAAIPAVNFGADPLPSIFGTGFHLDMEKVFSKLDPRRWLIETRVTYRGVPGTADLYDRRRKLLIDWKTTSKSKINRLRKDGPPQRARVQIQMYGQAMRATGEDVQRLALVYVPRDGSLDDLWVWSTVPDPAIADEAVDRYLGIASKVLGKDTDSVASVPATPGLLCGYCDHFSSGSTDLSRACPGRT